MAGAESDITVYVQARSGTHRLYFYGGASCGSWDDSPVMTLDSSTGYYIYKIQNVTAAVNVILRYGSGLQYPSSGGLVAQPGSTMLLGSDNSWKAYTPEVPPEKEKIRIYFEPRGYSTHKIYLHGGVSMTWPGVTPNYDETLKLYYYDTEAAAKVGVVVNNNNSGSQYPPNGTDIWADPGSTMILRANNTWEVYKEPTTNPPTEPGTEPPTEPGTEPPTEPGTEPPTEPEKDIYLTGWLNKGAVTGASSERKFKRASDDVYTLTYTFTNDEGGHQYATIREEGAYYVAPTNDLTDNPATLVKSSYNDSDANAAQKVKVVNAATNSTVQFTWKVSTKQLSYTVEEPPFVKESAFTSGFWIDTKEDIEDSSIALLKWYQKGSSYILYVPSGVDLTNVPVYHKYASLYINGMAIKSGTSYDLTALNNKSISGSVSGTLKVMQSSSASMYFKTQQPVDYLHTVGKVTKDKGTYLSVDKTGVQDNYGVLDQIKGRGNSSWQASLEIFNKYAYNIKLAKTANLFGMNKSKKWCLLANNVDESMMRNMVVYGFANDIGLDFSPQFTFIDLYDNSEYLGSYLITEKVEIGKNNLVKITDLADANEEANAGEDIETFPRGGSTGQYPEKGSIKYIQNMKNPDDITGGYLLEFEMDDRYPDEISGFVSKKGQHVVMKEPEFASYEEVSYISKFFNEAETAIYSSDGYVTSADGTRKHYSEYIDVDSFARMYLIQELTANLDAVASSFYIYKESDLVGDGKLHAAPVWDYDWALGQYYKGKVINYDNGANILYCDRTDQWWARNKNIYKAGMNANYTSDCTTTRNMIGALCQKDDFCNIVKLQWNNGFYDSGMNLVGSNGQINAYYNEIKDSVAMNESRWGFIGGNPSYSWGTKETGNTHSEAVNYLNVWMKDRLTWMNNQNELRINGNELDVKVAGISDTPQLLSVTNGVYSKPFEKLKKGTYTLSFQKGNSSIQTNTFDINLSSLGEVAEVEVEGNTNLLLTLDCNADVVIYYDYFLNKIFIQAAPYAVTYSIAYSGNDGHITEKTIDADSSYSEDAIIGKVLAHSPKLVSSYYSYKWSKAGVTIDMENCKATAEPDVSFREYSIKIFFGDVLLEEMKKPYQVNEDGEIVKESIVSLKKAIYAETKDMDRVEWYTIDAYGNERVLSTKDDYTFFTTRNITIYVREATDINKDYGATIFDPIYENQFVENNGVITEKITFKFPVNLSTPLDNYENLTSAGILLIECDQNGNPKDPSLVINKEILISAASGTAVASITNYSKAEVKPNSQGDFIYRLTITNNDKNAQRYFMAFGCMTIVDEEGVSHTYVSENFAIASIADYLA